MGSWRLPRVQPAVDGVLTAGIVCGLIWLVPLVYHNHLGGHGSTPIDASSPGLPELILGTDQSGSPVTLRPSEVPTLLLVLSVDCQYCAETMAVWREILAAAKDEAGTPRVVVLSTSSAARTKNYLEVHDFETNALVVMYGGELGALGIRGVPATIATDREAVRRWVGVLSPEDAASVGAWMREQRQASISGGG